MSQRERRLQAWSIILVFFLVCTISLRAVAQGLSTRGGWNAQDQLFVERIQRSSLRESLAGLPAGTKQAIVLFRSKILERNRNRMLNVGGFQGTDHFSAAGKASHRKIFSSPRQWVAWMKGERHKTLEWARQEVRQGASPYLTNLAYRMIQDQGEERARLGRILG